MAGKKFRGSMSRRSCRRSEAAFGGEAVVKSAGAVRRRIAIIGFTTASPPNAVFVPRQLQEHCNCGSEPAREGRSRAGSLPQ